MKLDFPFPVNDPLSFLVDDEIRTFKIDQRQDLTGTGAQACPQLSTGQFVVHEHVVPDNTAEIVMGYFPHLWQRIGVATPGESVELLNYADFAGFVLFDSNKDNNQPVLVETNYNRPTLAANPANKDRFIARGTTFVSDDAPVFSSLGMMSPLTTVYLPAKSIYRIVFSLTPVAAANPIPNPWAIGSGQFRIDFAGAMVFGLRMPAQTYDKIRTARRNGLLGPEAKGPAPVLR